MTPPRSTSRTTPSCVSAAVIVSSRLTVQTSGRGFLDLTAEIAGFVRDAGAIEGVVTLFIRHTSASLTIQENADPSVLTDLTAALQIPVLDRDLALGTWQAIYLIEHRARPHRREIVLQFAGNTG